MASEIEIIATRQTTLTPGAILDEFERINTDLLKDYFPANLFVGMIRGDETELLQKDEPLDQQLKYLCPAGKTPERSIRIYGPLEPFDEFWTAEDAINNIPHFPSERIGELVEKATAVHCSYQVSWGLSDFPVSNRDVGLTLGLVMANLLDGVIRNTLGAGLTPGTFLSEQWEKELRPSLYKIR